MNNTERAQVTSSSAGRWLWVVPLLAIAMVAFLVWRNMPPEGHTIVIHFDDVTGIKPGQTKLKYKGLEIGSIDALHLSKDKNKVTVKIEVEELALSMFNDKTEFWLVKPEIGTGGVSGINTLVSGPYITFKEGDGQPKREFEALRSPPLDTADGLTFYIKANLRHNISPGDEVFYKSAAVGKIIGYQLHSDHIIFTAQIDGIYKSLLRENSMFWEQSGLEVDASLFGVSISSAPILGLLSGGVSFATPNQYAKQSSAGAQFTLHNDREDEWLEWAPKIEIADHLITKDGIKNSKAEALTQGIESQ